MSRGRRPVTGSMAELWRPPTGAGEPVGCLTSTYTFDPGLFEEQCLARFLEIESEPSREDLAFLLERESRLGSAYAGVFVDHCQAGVEHSLRWDVLPTRIGGGKQHAKLSMLAWAGCVRVIVASSNLTEPGYRYNYEVAVPVDVTPGAGDKQLATDACDFLRSLLAYVAGGSADAPEVVRATDFLDRVERQVGGWAGRSSRGRTRQRLVASLPAAAPGRVARSALDEAIDACRRRGGSPDEAWVASPFFDADAQRNEAAAALCKSMARGGRREVWFAVPCLGEPVDAAPRLAAPRSLLTTAQRYDADVSVELLPQRDAEGNPRAWHAKMLALRAEGYTALMVGSSNFTRAGLGVAGGRNAEANLLTIVDRDAYAREPRELEAVWPELPQLDDPEAAQWVGPLQELAEEEQAPACVLPAGFVSATYRAGEPRQLAMRFDPGHLPADGWSVSADAAQAVVGVLDAAGWRGGGGQVVVTVNWPHPHPPRKLSVQWHEGEAFWPLNVEDARELPPPAVLDGMSADDMLAILAASDPGAAFRAWARQRQSADDAFDDELDAVTAPIDLDPLRRYDLHATFLHRVRRRARVLARLRENLQRPVHSGHALEWRLRGLVGIEPLALRLAREVASAGGAVDEAMLTLADFLIVLREVKYQSADGALAAGDFERSYRSFLRDLVERLEALVAPHRARVGGEVATFWDRVVGRCRS